MDIKPYFNVALLEAQKAFKKNLVPVGAVLVHHKNIISQAHNKTSPLEHAEMIVLKEGFQKLGHQLSECTLFVTVEPCQMCLGALSLCNIKAVYFGAYNEKSITNPKIPIYGGFHEKPCSDLIKKFFEALR